LALPKRTNKWTSKYGSLGVRKIVIVMNVHVSMRPVRTAALTFMREEAAPNVRPIVAATEANSPREVHHG
jgi:hypothetical protein